MTGHIQFFLTTKSVTTVNENGFSEYQAIDYNCLQSTKK